MRVRIRSRFAPTATSCIGDRYFSNRKVTLQYLKFNVTQVFNKLMCSYCLFFFISTRRQTSEDVGSYLLTASILLNFTFSKWSGAFEEFIMPFKSVLKFFNFSQMLIYSSQVNWTSMRQAGSDSAPLYTEITTHKVLIHLKVIVHWQMETYWKIVTL